MSIKGKKGGKGGGPTAPAFYEAPNTLRSKQTARIVDLLGEGEIVGLVAPAGESVFLDNTPLVTAGQANFRGVTLDGRVGLPTQDHIPGFPSVEAEQAVSIELLAGAPIVRTITDPDVDAVRIKLRFPNLSFFNTATNQLGPQSVQWLVEIAEDGGPFVTYFASGISGKTTSPYEAEWRFELPPGGSPWQVRVTRTSPDATSANVNDKTFWSSFTLVKDVKLSYPDTALVALTVDAEQFGSQVPNRSYLVDGLKIQVPDNYDPVTRLYTGIWGGAFQTAFSNNPAWVFYDMLSKNRYGLGDFVDATQIDKFALYAIGQYCDELVDDGQGGQEPRFVFNGSIGDQREAFQVLSSIVSAFQGMQYWGSAVVTATQDSPADPVKLVSPANVIDGEFDYSGSSLKARHTTVYVTWNDPELNYRPNIEPVEDLDLIARFGVRKKDVVAFGCTSRGQAKRYGRWILDTERYATEAVRYRASLDHADVRPGDIVAIADPTIANVRFGGRVVGFPTPGVTVEVDAPVELQVGETYQISFVKPDNSVVSVDITDAPGTYTTLTMDSDPGDVLDGAMWSITASNVEPRQFRIINVREINKNEWEIEGILHDPNKYARIEQGLRLEPPPFTLFPTGPIPAPTALNVTEYLTLLSGTVSPRATFSWTPPNDGRVKFFEAAVQRPGAGGFEELPFTSANSVDVGDIEPGTHTFRVRALTSLGQISGFTELTLDLFGLFNPPADVANCQIENINSSVRLTWDPNADLDLAGYEIRFSAEPAATASFSASTLLQIVPKEANSIILPGLVGTYLIKAFDTSGVRSVNACLVESNIAALQGLNAVLAIEEHPDWLGVKDDVVVDGSNCLRLSSGTVMDDWGVMDDVVPLDTGGIVTPGTYFFDEEANLGAVFTTRVSGSLVVNGIDTTFVMGAWPDLSSVASLSGSVASNYNATLQIRTTTDDPTGSPTWGPWQTLIAGDYTFWGAQFRIILESFCPTCSPQVCEARVEIDMEDRVEGESDLSYSPGGYLTINFDFPFFQRPAIAIDGESLQEGWQADVINKSETGFDVRFLDETGAEVAVTFDWLARGFGKLVP